MITLPSGGHLSARVHGDAKAPPLVLLHALEEGALDWDAFAGELGARWRVIALDLPGHGRSHRPATYSFEAMADDVTAALDVLGLERTALVGHSMGGTVAYLIAQTHPERISALVIEDVIPPWPRQARTLQRPEEELGFDWTAVVDIAAAVNDPTMRWWPGLTAITAPTLLIAGGPTSHVPQDRIAEAAAAIPCCQMLTIDAGHDVHIARPHDFATAATGFLEDHRGA